MLRRFVNISLVVLSVVLLVISAAWLIMESHWSRWTPLQDEPMAHAHAFAGGSIGLEVFPLKYAVVLNEISGAAFGLTEDDQRTVWEAYGFLPDPGTGDATDAICPGAPDFALPYGFHVSNMTPATAQRTPVEFVGLTCAACHSGVLETPDGSSTDIIVGMGNPRIDLIAFTDGVRNALLDPELSLDDILNAYDRQCGADNDSNFIDRHIEAMVLNAWLEQARDTFRNETANYGLPFDPDMLRDARVMPAGPGRTRPFRSVVRVALGLPGEENYAFSKIPAVFEQRTDLRPRAQYDGSIAGPVTRSFIAAYASGASLLALADPEVESNIRNAAAFTETLGIDTPVPFFSESFPNHMPEIEDVDEGFDVYLGHCARCHGYRAYTVEDDQIIPGPWVAEGDDLHGYSYIDPTDGSEPIGTDPERVTFRYSEILALALGTTLPGWQEELEAQRALLIGAATAAGDANRPAIADFWGEHQTGVEQSLGGTRPGQLDRLNLSARQFRLGHPLYFSPDDLSDEPGYVNNPVPFAYLRPPYLHNGSVPTMRQLINLDERPEVFCRGDNSYDPGAMGLVAPELVLDESCPDTMPFRFDTTARGNSNQGHDWPWPRGHEDYDAESLEALMAYLKIL